MSRAPVQPGGRGRKVDRLAADQTASTMASKIVRPVFALLVLGIAVHAGHALIGPGDGPLDTRND